MIIGHKRQIAYLKEALKRGRLSHAYLFHGPDHVGKLTIALSLAKALHCTQRKGDQNNDWDCGRCSSCRLIANGTHPHVLMLDTAHALVSKEEDRSEIPIQDIRELKRLLALAPEADKWRIAIINQADTMSEEASHAFLKILEEPGERTLYVLVTSAPDLLLRTVLSRSTSLRFGLVSQEDISAFLQEKIRQPAKAAEIAAQAYGRPGLAIRMAEDEAYRNEVSAFRNKFEAALGNGIPGLLRLSQSASQDEELRERIIERSFAYLRGRLMDPHHHQGRLPALAQAIRRMDSIATLLATTNVNTRLALDMLLIQLAGL
ncbi:MAG: hypothetical protein HY221_00580 [Candidatus Sungbacteria bacterium]|uniref:DNA polymerase III subunit delta n=1 Tax=Candidatus Sungiibacteriota bacterium TaxID=2750080 RepID=A0A932R0L6_9BACT|nr:hypothetical protein [Candidatus Sungbacteria bacterium]